MTFMTDKKDISVVIPVFNSEKTISDLANEIIDKLSGTHKIELILVNDCSKDGSENSCLDLFKKFPNNVKYYRLAKNVGEHNAVMAGLNHATGDWAIIMDDDFQNPVSEVSKLINFILTNEYDVVYTKYKEKSTRFLETLVVSSIIKLQTSC